MKNNKVIKNPQAYYYKVLSNTLVSENRWLLAKCRAPFWGDALKLDDLRAHNDESDFRENSLDSDNGAGVAAIVNHLDRGLEQSANSEWRKLFAEAFNSLDATAKAIYSPRA